MLRMIRNIVEGRRTSSGARDPAREPARSCCDAAAARRARRLVLLALALGAALLPLAARPHDPSAPPELVAEALFLCDHLPPGGRDVNLSVAMHRAAPDPITGAAALALAPRAQLAMA